MCGFYDDEQKIKKGDKAIYQEENITIVSVKHIRENRTMDISYTIDSIPEIIEQLINIPYKTAGFGFELLSRKD